MRAKAGGQHFAMRDVTAGRAGSSGPQFLARNFLVGTS